MTELEFREWLDEAIQFWFKENGDIYSRTYSFRDRGVLTNNEGLIVKISEQEYQVTIVKSR